MANVYIRNVPEDVHRRLKAEAAASGQSLNAFLLARLSEVARTPTISELAERVRRRVSDLAASAASGGGSPASA